MVKRNFEWGKRKKVMKIRNVGIGCGVFRKYSSKFAQNLNGLCVCYVYLLRLYAARSVQCIV